MSADPRTLGWLARALNHEMRAVQQYLAQSVLARLWGDDALARRLRAEALEELEHAERLMARQIMLGVAPSAGNIAPARLGRSAAELLAADQQLEVDAVRLYQDALLHAQRMRDPESVRLLADLLEEERAHVGEIDGMLHGDAHHG